MRSCWAGSRKASLAYLAYLAQSLLHMKSGHQKPVENEGPRTEVGPRNNRNEKESGKQPVLWLSRIQVPNQSPTSLPVHRRAHGHKLWSTSITPILRVTVKWILQSQMDSLIVGLAIVATKSCRNADISNKTSNRCGPGKELRIKAWNSWQSPGADAVPF